jgi:hypothetical protein
MILLRSSAAKEQDEQNEQLKSGIIKITDFKSSKEMNIDN